MAESEKRRVKKYQQKVKILSRCFRQVDGRFYQITVIQKTAKIIETVLKDYETH